VVRSLENHQMGLPQLRILNGFGAASELTKAPRDRGIIPITGMVVMSSNLEAEGQKIAISNEAKAGVQERFPMAEAKEIIEYFSELAPAEGLTTAIIGRTPELITFRQMMTQGILSGRFLPLLEGGLLAAAIIAQAIADKTRLLKGKKAGRRYDD
jgi:hypothetical protein